MEILSLYSKFLSLTDGRIVLPPVREKKLTYFLISANKDNEHYISGCFAHGTIHSMMENRFYRVKSKCQLVEPCAEVSITSSGVYAPVIYEHCEHCNCSGCTSFVDAPRSEDKLLEHVEAEQRSTSGSSIKRQLSKQLPPEVISLFEGELSPPNTSEDVVQSEFLETSEDLEVDNEEVKTEIQLLKESFEEAKATQTYGDLFICTFPKRQKVVTFNEEGESYIQAKACKVGRPIRVSVSTVEEGCVCKRQPQRRGSSYRYRKH